MPSVSHRLTQTSTAFPVTQHDDKIKLGFHHELLRNLYAARWLEDSMATDLAKLQLFQLNEELLRLHGRCANFSPEIIKHDKMHTDMSAAKQTYDTVVHESLLQVKRKRQRDMSVPSIDSSPPPPRHTHMRDSRYFIPLGFFTIFLTKYLHGIILELSLTMLLPPFEI